MAPQQRKRATIRDVAEATGLSPAAVSYALRGIQTSPETQERVRRAAAELGYNVDRIARALASGRTGTVGLLFGSLDELSVLTSTRRVFDQHRRALRPELAHEAFQLRADDDDHTRARERDALEALEDPSQRARLTELEVAQLLRQAGVHVVEVRHPQPPGEDNADGRAFFVRVH